MHNLQHPAIHTSDHPAHTVAHLATQYTHTHAHLHTMYIRNFLRLSVTHTHTHKYKSTRTKAHVRTLSLTHTHTHDTRGVAWGQMMLKAGGTPLLMYVHNDGTSCLYAAAKRGHSAVAEVYVCRGRQREARGRVWAATAHGTWCRGCRQHTTPRRNTLQRTAKYRCSVGSS